MPVLAPDELEEPQEAQEVSRAVPYVIATFAGGTMDGQQREQHRLPYIRVPKVTEPAALPRPNWESELYDCVMVHEDAALYLLREVEPA